MFQETEYKIENFQKPLIDFDITQSGSLICVTGYFEIISRRENLSIPFGTHIHFGDKSCSLDNEIRNPLVRSINENIALVLGSNKQNNEIDSDNAWIINSNGEIKASFSTNSAVENVVVTKDFIVVTYFDETACYGEDIEIYDFKGKFLFGYEELFCERSVEVFDCYAVALVGENQIIFCPYTKFPLVLFDIETKTQKVWKTPTKIHGSHAISKYDEKIYFHRPYPENLEGKDFGIYEWQIGSTKAERVFEYESHFTRGLPNGKFFAKTDSGYSIISLK